MGGLGRGLTEKEKKTFCALVMHPGYNDRELAELIEVNLSTVTAIRRRLTSSNYYSRTGIPSVQYLGGELLTITYGDISEIIPREERDKLLADFVNNNDRICHAFTSENSGVIMFISKNYTEIQVDIDKLQKILKTNNMVSSMPWEHAIFPFDVSTSLNYFDYSYLLSRSMSETGFKMPKIDLNYKKYEKRNLTTKEKAVLLCLVENPALSDSAIAKKVEVSRQTISKIKQRFEDNNLLRMANIPCIDQIGCETMILSHIHFNPNALLEERNRGVSLLLDISPVIFDINGRFETVMINVVNSYEEYNDYKNKLISYYASHNFIKEDPKIYSMPVKNINYIKNLDFSGVLMSLLEQG